MNATPLWRRGGSALLALTVATTVGLFAVAAAPAEPAQAAIGPLVFSDEFNGPAGTAPDRAKWRVDTGGSGNGNNELQYYSNRSDNIAQNGAGQLAITARRNNPANYNCWYGRCTYTSGKMTTAATFTRTYGRFEARLKIPRGQGMWPAFWMLGNDIGSVGWPNCGEIDIMENVGSVPGQVLGSLHGPGYSGGSPLSGSRTLPNGQAYADAFHTFTVDWAPGSVTWYIDGVQYSRKTPADTRGNRWVFSHPFFMILNLAVGGNWPGPPNGSTVFPQSLLVDWVRVYSWV